MDPVRDGTSAALFADRPVLGRGGLALICRLQLVPADPRDLLVRAASSRASDQVCLMGECGGECPGYVRYHAFLRLDDLDLLRQDVLLSDLRFLGDTFIAS